MRKLKTDYWTKALPTLEAPLACQARSKAWRSILLEHQNILLYNMSCLVVAIDNGLVGVPFDLRRSLLLNSKAPTKTRCLLPYHPFVHLPAQCSGP